MKSKTLNFLFFIALVLCVNYFVLVEIYSKPVAIHIEEKQLKATNENAVRLCNYIDKHVGKLKIFIANVSDRINVDLIANATNYGHGSVLSFSENTPAVNFDTNQYALDLIFYQRLRSDYSVQVRSIQEANVVYIPFMLGTLCRHYDMETDRNSVFSTKYMNLYHNMAVWFKHNGRVLGNKTVFFVLSRVETVLPYVCPMRTNTLKRFRKYVRNLHMATYARCEPEKCADIQFSYKKLLMPYATMSKFALRPNQIEYKYDLNGNRVVDVFFGGNKRPDVNMFRRYMYRNMKIQTSLTFYEFIQTRPNSTTEPLMVLFKLGYSYQSELKKLIDWKLNSKLCLEPHGDTPTRRSFWDSIFLGCIPVVFTNYELPFSDHIDYSRFVIRLNLTFDRESKRRLRSTSLQSFLKPYLQNTQWLYSARAYISEIRQFIQLSWPFDIKTGKLIDFTFKYDAYGMILAKLAQSVLK